MPEGPDLQILRFNDMKAGDWAEVVAAIGRGRLVCLPTDTVYGIACDPSNDRAVDLLYAVKGRDRGKPLALMFADMEQLRSRLPELPDALWRRVAALLPGPVTVVLPGGAGSLGARLAPARFSEVFARLPLPLAMTSANLSGEPEPHVLGEVPPAIGDACELAVDDGPCELGRATTVVDLRPLIEGSRPRLLREGALERARLEQLIGACR